MPTIADLTASAPNLSLGDLMRGRTREAARQEALPAPYASYQTSLPALQEMAFKQWAHRNNVPFDPSPQADYDMRGFWRALMNKDPRATSGMNPNDNAMHYPDYWKTPYHESFSNESKWNTTGEPGWNDQDQLVNRSGQVVFDERKRSRGRD
jgi:hypothetical protein